MVSMRERKQQKQEAGSEQINVKGKMKKKRKEQEHDKNPIDGIRVSELLTDMRLWKNKDRYET
jgi:hypothetical protein